MRIISRISVAVAAGVAVALAGGLTALAVSHGHTAQASTANAAAAAGHVTPTPLRVRSVSPAAGSSGVSGTSTITVTYDQPVPASTPFPRLSPDIAGSWRRSGDSVMFTPATGFGESTRVRVDATETGDGDRAGYTSAFTTGRFSTLRLQEVLAELGYLPLTWRPAVGGAVPERDAAAQLAAAYTPPPGTFARRSGYPGSMYGFWQQGSANVMDSGAIAGFEDDHGLTANGDAGPAVWAALLKAAAAGGKDSHGYSYAVASESSPESLTIWHDGRQVFYSPANTGIPGAPTALGTFFVYEKLPFQIMQGTNPDGSAYSDPVEWVSYFNGGDAVHYFPRGSYGWPQSLGCVELPWSTAEEAYGDLPYGTMVTVASLPLPLPGYWVAGTLAARHRVRVRIRRERDDDIPAIRAVTAAAFGRPDTAGLRPCRAGRLPLCRALRPGVIAMADTLLRHRRAHSRRDRGAGRGAGRDGLSRPRPPRSP